MQKCFELAFLTTLDDHKCIFKVKMLWQFLDYRGARYCHKKQLNDRFADSNNHKRKTENILAGIQSGHSFLFHTRQKVSIKWRQKGFMGSRLTFSQAQTKRWRGFEEAALTFSSLLLPPGLPASGQCLWPFLLHGLSYRRASRKCWTPARHFIAARFTTLFWEVKRIP